jgi:hypothetical protein
MQISKVPQQKRSLGALRKANKTKPRSPDLTGQLRLQRHTATAIVEQFNHDNAQDVVCNIAGWRNQDQNGSYLTVQLSPHFTSRVSVEKDDVIGSIIDDQGEVQD